MSVMASQSTYKFNFFQVNNDGNIKAPHYWSVMQKEFPSHHDIMKGFGLCR